MRSGAKTERPSPAIVVCWRSSTARRTTSTQSTHKGSKTGSPNSISRRPPEPRDTIEFADGSSHVDLAYHDQQTPPRPQTPRRGLQQLGNGRGTHFVTQGAKRRRQLVVALGDPSQRPHRVAHRRRLEQSLQVLQQRRVLDRQPRSAPALAPHLSRQGAGVPQVLQTAPNRAPGDLRRALNRRRRSSSEGRSASNRTRRDDSSIIITI